MLDAVLSAILGGRRRAAIDASVGDEAAIERDCLALLGLGPDGGKRAAERVLAGYAALPPEARLRFFRFLADDLDLDAIRVRELADAYRREPTADRLAPLLQAAEPRRQELLRRLNTVAGATADLVAMRADLLRHAAADPAVARADLDFRHLFQSWFNRGFLELTRISWDTPASVLAKIIAYEAVHEINGWEDLRSRLQPADRRCYAFFHPAMPGEPLVFTEVALVKGTPGNVQRVLDEERDEMPAEGADTAVFYSISNCQRGLAGVSFGNLLIKQVVADLGRELPGLKTFVTLSPLPGFARWLEGLDDVDGVLAAREAALSDEYENDRLAPLEPHGARLAALAARYLATAKRAGGAPLDPVARFHLANGAEIHAVHAGADESANGVRQSAGVMVNYLYDLARVEKRQEAFAEAGHVAMSRAARSLSDGAGTVRPRIAADAK